MRNNACSAACLFFATILLVCVLGASADARVIRVRWDSPADGAGDEWANAYRTVTAAIAASVSGDEIWVAAGSDHPYHEQITLKNGVALYGGFAGNEATRSQRDWLANSTEITGNADQVIVTAKSGVTAATVLDGFVIRGGDTGISCSSASPMISNNRITGNKIGIGCSGSSSAIASNTISANTVGINGYQFGGPVLNNIISANGTGVSLSSSHDTPIANNTIACNGSDGIRTVGSDPQVTNNIIAFNATGYSSDYPSLIRSNNCVYNPGGSNYDGPNAEATDIIADPKLQAAEFGRLHLQPDSPCLDAGLDIVVGAGSLDIDGQPRILGAHVDIGADESDGTQWPSHVPGIVRVSPGGVDDASHDGSTWELAKRTIQAGAAAVSETGGSVWISGGVYNEQVTIPPSVSLYGGFAGGELSPGDRVAGASETVVNGGGSGNVLRPVGGYRCSVIDGLTIHNGDVGILCAASSPVITKCRITGNWTSGISCDGTAPAVTANAILANGLNGVDCSFSSKPVLTGNAICGSGAYGINCHNASPVVVNNSLSGNGSGIYIYSGSPQIINNAIAFNGTGIEAWDYASGIPAVSNNCLFNPDGTDYIGIEPGAGDFQADPKFRSARLGDLHIQPDSPCVDAGLDSAVALGAPDIDGQARIQPAHVDVGADESDGTAWPELEPVVVRVSPAGADDDAHDGSTWELAKRTVQAGIDAVFVTGGEVWVAAGLYEERVKLPALVYLYGGFAGRETSLGDRDAKDNPSVLDGGGSVSVVTTAGSYRSSAIDGLTIRGGITGVYCDGSSPIISNNTITGNESGVYCYEAEPLISGNTISFNSDSGIECYWGSPAIVGNTLLENGYYGINCGTYARPLITGNKISGSGRGIYGSDFLPQPAITRNTLTANGAGIYIEDRSPTIANNIVSLNDEGIVCRYGAPTITNNTLTGNTHGIYCYKSSLKVTNNIVAFNEIGMYQYSSGTPILSSNCLYNPDGANYSGMTGGADDILADPKFQSAAYGKLHIQPDSPCVDAGADASVAADWTDIDGQPRVLGTHVDIGADESDGAIWPEYVPVIVRVSPDGLDDAAHDGSSWELAKRTVQAAADAAAIGGEVWVAAGVYDEHVSAPPYVFLYGGFAGTETLSEQRDWNSNATVLDGGGSGDVVAFAVGYRAGRIDGFVIRNGQYGISCHSGSPVVANNDVSGCTSAGIDSDHSSPVIVGNRVTANGVSGISCHVSAAAIRGNVIARNGARGISCDSSLSPMISGNTIIGNGEKGIYCDYESTALISNNTIAGHSTYGIETRISSPVITNNTISSNGAGVYSYASSPKITNNIVAFNATGIKRDSHPTGTLLLSHNCVYNPGGVNYAGQAAGANDISADPQLQAVGYAMLHIQPGSPCVDAALDSAVAPGWTDIDGQPRFQGARVDIGADESDGTTWPDLQPRVVRVSPGGVDDAAHNGSTWELAKKTVQAGIDAVAVTCGDVWVAAGAYQEHVTAPFGVYLFGGFAGTESLRGERDWKSNLSVLDGGGTGTVVTIRGGYRSGVLDGFVVRNGRDGIYPNMSSPGILNNVVSQHTNTGIYISKTSPIIIGNTISSCNYSIYSRDSAAPEIRGNTISGSTSTGIFCYTSSSPVIEGNSISGGGYGIRCESSSSPAIAGNRISNCSTGIRCSGSSSQITNNVLTDNTQYGIDCYLSPLVIAGNIINGGSRGVNCSSSSPRITNNTICGRASLDTGIYYYSSSSPRITNNIVAFNWRGIYGSGGTPVVSSNCVYNPQGTNYSGVGAGAGDINVDPLFEDRAGGNLHIVASSPCIDKGSSAAPELPLLDFDGQGRVYRSAVDIGADEVWPKPMTIADAKSAPDGALVSLADAVVTASWPDVFYIEHETRASGIRVEKSGHALHVGQQAAVSGAMTTSPNGERCIAADTAAHSGTGSILPVTVRNLYLGGGDTAYGWPGPGQKGVAGSLGLNTIGLLVRTAGVVSVPVAQPGCFYVDDASGAWDGTGIGGIYVDATGMAVPEAGTYAAVTGISSCRWLEGKLVNVLRPRRQDDIATESAAMFQKAAK